MADLIEFIEQHRPHGTLAADATEPTKQGYLLIVDSVKIEYVAEDVGGAGIKKVALYVSRDGGQTWTFAKEDEDAQSPLSFEDLDGFYSLCLVATDKLGNSMPAPLPGTKPRGGGHLG